jgi:hypothetical protein
MMKKLIFLITLFSFANLFAQGDAINSYSEKIKEFRKINLYNLNDIDKVKSDCGAYFDKTSNTLTTENECHGNFWMENLRDLDTPYEFEMSFTPSSNFDEKTNKFLVHIILGNSPNGYTWLGFDKNGYLEISTRDTEGWTDKLKVLNAAKVNFNKENHLKFIHFPDGVYYVELNSYSKWSYDLPEAAQKIPFIGLSNRIHFYIDVELSMLNLNTYQEEDPVIAELEDITANMQADQLLGIESDIERLEFRNQMKIMFDGACYGNCKNGYGIYDYNDGLQYLGYWKNREFSGEGKLYTNGNLYVNGNFENGTMHGYCEVFKDGEMIFKGQFKNGEPVQD